MTPNGSQFKHACFISYKHPPRGASENHFYKWFPQAFCERLNEYLSSDIRAYIDSKADPGSSYPMELSEALCNSVCMVAILVPEYLESNWCQAEWEAMARLEEKRLGKGKVGLIIPIALKRTVGEWEHLLKRKPIDFSRVFIKGQLKQVKPTEKIIEIADIINNWVAQLNETCENCDGFLLPVEGEVMSSQPTFKDPNPFK